MLLGEFYGMNTLNKLLSNYELGNSYQKIWQKISCQKLLGVMNKWLWRVFSKEFVKRLNQSDATQSRQKLTSVIDSSIFKQWLKNEEFGKYFGKYFSGQYKSTVYGFNIMLYGMSIGDIFYPLHFQLRQKKKKDPEVAQTILGKVHRKLSKLAQDNQVELPTLYLSVDSGFRSTGLIQYCEALGVIYIGVPKVNHLIELDDKRMKIKDLKKEFEEKEADWKKENGDEKAFTWRVRVDYNCVNEEVTLLLFRLNGSKKVSVIFTPDLDIKAKTMRRHWFERTKIELLFRMLKHNFKIQQTTTYNRLGFLKKFSFALVKSVYAQLFTQIVKKTNPRLQRLGFEGIQQKLIFHQIGKEWLDELVFS
jgi:hypothetical protein